ncbi:MAG: metallophosphoesterase [Clostridia bacterium]|nr:metallophosphoesterase [Clostridia bacterium]
MTAKVKRCIILLLALAVVLFSVWFYNNFTLKITEETVTSEKVEGEIKIVVMSDLHSFRFGKDNLKLIEKTKKLSPDLIFFVGDIYSRGQTSKIGQAVSLLESLGKIADVYVVTGDHDTDELYKNELKKAENVTLLDYTKKDIAVKGNELSLYGIDNVYFSSTFDLGNEFDTPSENRLNILLSHIPSIEHYGDFGFDFIFCGDTHGGMVRLPFLNGLYFNGYLLPELTYNGIVTDKGLFEFENTSLFVTSGLGNYPLPLRFNNRPEICLITIKGE